MVNKLIYVRSEELRFSEDTVVDQDGDGLGEFGWRRELCGALPPRRKDDGSPRQPVVYITEAYAVGFFPELDVACTVIGPAQGQGIGTVSPYGTIAVENRRKPVCNSHVRLERVDAMSHPY